MVAPMPVRNLLTCRPDVDLTFRDERDPGHPGEYILHVAGASADAYISPHFTRILELDLPEWNVSNRGTRVEISHRTTWMHRDDDTVLAAVDAAFGSYAEQGGTADLTVTPRF